MRGCYGNNAKSCLCKRGGAGLGFGEKHLMIDPVISLAFGVYSSKGVYALLLGSGVSRGAGIPTGWEVMEDLIRKIAALAGTDCGDDPAAWYACTYGKQPSYDTLLDALTKSPSERSAMLRPYFEPTDEEREDGLKTPTAAHKTIARLVRNGYTRVILTTNFDRLLEMAIEEEGLVPIVLSTDDAVEGAMPLVHSSCTVIKLHGDYLDTRIKNTPSELEQYDRRVAALLDRILDEYGVIVCGWSAEYDTALRAAFERCTSRRFPRYWAAKGEPGDHAKRLTAHMGAQSVRIESADQFFADLSDKVQSLEESARPHPLSAKVAVASIKRHLVDDRHKIQLEELVAGETEKLYAALADTTVFPVAGYSLNPETLVRLTEQYRDLAGTLMQLMAAGCRWGEPHQSHVWSRCVERIANGPQFGWSGIQLYPALLLIYVGGIIAVSNHRYHNLFALLKRAMSHDHRRERFLCEAVNTESVISRDRAREFPGYENRAVSPASDRLFDVLRPVLTEHLPSDSEYERAFDRFEILWTLANGELKRDRAIRPNPIGRYAWRYRAEDNQSLLRSIRQEASIAGTDWGPLRAGFFGSDLSVFERIAEELREPLERISNMY